MTYVAQVSKSQGIVAKSKLFCPLDKLFVCPRPKQFAGYKPPLSSLLALWRCVNAACARSYACVFIRPGPTPAWILPAHTFARLPRPNLILQLSTNFKLFSAYTTTVARPSVSGRWATQWNAATET